MEHRKSSFLNVLTTGLAAAFLVAATIYIALSQPWMGLTLSGQNVEQGLRVVAVDPGGPATGIKPGDYLLRVAGGGQELVLQPFDAVEEPDAARTYAEYRNFFVRQGRIANIIHSGTVTFTLGDGSKASFTPYTARPIISLPIVFWMQLLAGFTSALISGWALGFRQNIVGVRILVLSNAALLIGCFPTAIYTSRELALGGNLFRALSALNSTGSLGFCVLLLALFLVYPRRLVPLFVLGLLAAVFVLWSVIEFFQIGLSVPGVARYLPITLTASAAFLAAAMQYLRARGDPQTRTAIGWFGFSLALCIAIFNLFYTIPPLLGREADVPPVAGFAIALILFGGMTLSVVRYRLLDIEIWTFRLLLYGAGVVAFAIFHILLISVTSLDEVPAFGVSLAAVSALFILIRAAITRHFLPQQNLHRQMFEEVVNVAMTVPNGARNQKWQDLLIRAFGPLHLESTAEFATPHSDSNGRSLNIPGGGLVSPLRLVRAQAGIRSFSRRDVDLAGDLYGMLRHSSASRDAYAQGIAEERARIGRDMHDNIGAKLLSALHGTRPESKDAMIRDALSDLRDIINNVTGLPQTLDESLAELRLETAERLSAAGLAMRWTSHGDDDAPVSPIATHALRSIVREGVSNSIRHANAKTVTVEIAHANGWLALTISDDGQCAAADLQRGTGSGLAGIRARVVALKGQMEIIESGPGFTLKAQFSSVQGSRT
ncbi:signal transduction histidine kinase (plasmid) [Hoeflea sp. IMCC20628]|uniref:ATP-binding protein n=1 Tax=Hoeflea sp. IMCC20628 TaxID=1620421 RepID=UPI00063A9A71|nr:ATP-binding protein [Hoeflea sp. IMCC20628]AKI03538.1 signal transduction histidine kinase [Hoeflea sp. IMCC20628]